MVAVEDRSTCIHVGVDVVDMAGSEDKFVSRAVHEILSAKIDRDPDDYGQHSEEDAMVRDGGVSDPADHADPDLAGGGRKRAEPDSPRNNHRPRRLSKHRRYDDGTDP